MSKNEDFNPTEKFVKESADLAETIWGRQKAVEVLTASDDRARTLVAGATLRINSLKLETRALRELLVGMPCYVAHPGEATYECNINKLCPACEARDFIQAGRRDD